MSWLETVPPFWNKVRSHCTEVNLSDFHPSLSHPPRPWTKMADVVSMVTLPLASPCWNICSIARRDEWNSIRITSTREGWPLWVTGYKSMYFSYRPSNEPSNLRTPSLRYRGEDDDETVIMSSKICNPMQFMWS